MSKQNENIHSTVQCFIIVAFIDKSSCHFHMKLKEKNYTEYYLPSDDSSWLTMALFRMTRLCMSNKTAFSIDNNHLWSNIITLSVVVSFHVLLLVVVFVHKEWSCYTHLTPDFRCLAMLLFSFICRMYLWDWPGNVDVNCRSNIALRYIKCT